MIDFIVTVLIFILVSGTVISMFCISIGTIYYGLILLLRLDPFGILLMFSGIIVLLPALCICMPIENALNKVQPNSTYTEKYQAIVDEYICRIKITYESDPVEPKGHTTTLSPRYSELFLQMLEEDVEFNQAVVERFNKYLERKGNEK